MAQVTAAVMALSLLVFGAWVPPGPAGGSASSPRERADAPAIRSHGLPTNLGATDRSRLLTKAVPLIAHAPTSLQRERFAGKAAPESLHAIVLLCDFADSLLYGRYGSVPGDFPPPRQSDFYYAAHDSVYFQFQMGDVAAYFAAVSGGKFTLAWDVLGGVADLPQPMAHYGNAPGKGDQPALLAADAIAALDSRVDFSRYDTVVLIHAGAGEETDVLNNSPEQIYSTFLGAEDFARAAVDSVLPQPYIPTNDLDARGQPVHVTNVLILPETEFQDPVPPSYSGYAGSLGVYCFEFGLRLGMLSLSDFTPSGAPDSEGVGEFDLMGYGLFVGAGYVPSEPSIFNKMLMGWIKPLPVEPDAGGTYALAPIEAAGSGAPGDSLAARIEIGGREYWLVEYRQEDPDGNRIFSFTGDLNHNNIPDFYDADSANGDGTPTGLFDPATDTRESLTGAEWDFFMSENGAMPAGVHGGRGSGLLIWHVDEGVIEGVIGAPENLFNADPRHKSVDLEEADGIQDLDSRQQSPWMLGGDFDSFRGENNATFGPDTNPDTRSASGAWTGVVVSGISNVVADSSVVAGTPPDTARVVRFAQRLRFQCSRVVQGQGGPELAAQRVLEGVDLTGSHLLAVDLHTPRDGRLEIVAGGARGEVLAFEPDLTDFAGDHAELGPGVLAAGTDAAGAPARWNGPAAAGDIDGDGRPEIVLTARDGLYAFNGEDGSEVADGDGNPASHGLLMPLAGCSVPPVLLSGSSAYSPDRRVVVAVLDATAAPVPALRLRFVDPQAHSQVALELGSVIAKSPPVPVWAGDGQRLLALAVADTAADAHELLLIGEPTTDAPAQVAARVPLAIAPGSLPPAAVAAQGLFGVVVTGRHGEAETVWFDRTPTGPAISHRDAWPDRIAVTTPMAAGAAFAGGGLFTLTTPSGHPLAGWPVRPLPAVAADSLAAAPSPLRAAPEVEATPGATQDAAVHWLFQSRDGRLFLYDETGRLASGWPVAGPSEPAGSPVWGFLEGASAPTLVAAGTFQRIDGRDPNTGTLVTTPVSRLMAWTGAGVTFPGYDWPMWQQNPWRAPTPPDQAAPAADDGLLVAGSHICYPSPLASGPLHVRAVFKARCTARAYLYDLAGEAVTNSPALDVSGAGPFEIDLPVEKIASGMYLCRLVAERPGGGRESSVVSVAVAR